MSAHTSSSGAAGATGTAAAGALRDDARTIGVVSLAHGISHFFHLLLPPLFPVFIREFGLSYSELGLLVTAFFVISGIGQAGAGFLVDRVGARPVLFVAMGCFVAGALAAAGAQGYGGLMVAAGLAGLGNSAFHPVDFTILNKRVSQPRLGHAFSAHGIAGNLGWAAAPVFLAGAMAVTGSWRLAYVGAAVLALLVTLVLVLNRRAIDDRLGAWAHEKQPAGARGAVPEHPMAFLRLPSVWMCFAFFFWSTAALSGIQAFASPALQQIYGLPLSVTVSVVTAYMLCAAAGMVAGGFLVARTQRLERTIALAMSAAAVLLMLAGIGVLPGLVVAALVALAGAGVGLAGPSRDMLVKQASPPGATGRVYGTVYSGLDIGFALAAPVFGALMDHGQPNGVFYGSALALVMGIASAGLISLNVSRPRVSTAAVG
ncbi:MAG: MFS transporter [Methylibium sp.]|uniref:MFS transporter n=1 Tax=Methylibium sp. TaxID=2067992 RepID=UPI001848D841|nr:MFS transporter [Methylibium sp.]MBA3597866.1 MFS transporter [Methylibium sp.]